MKETIHQVSLLQALVNSYYDGIISVGELKKLGDVGIGTFDGADGEMIYVDKKVFKARIDGQVMEVSDDETIPFANSCTFITDDKIKINVENMTKLKTTLNRYRDRSYKNLFIAFRIKGLFKKLVVRTIPKQNKPYNPLDVIVENEQKLFTRNNVEGTLIGFLFPRYMKELNTSDLHMHFISNDRTYGGHVLDIEFEQLEMEISIKRKLDLILPNNDKFNNHNVVVNNKIVQKVEE